MSEREIKPGKLTRRQILTGGVMAPIAAHLLLRHNTDAIMLGHALDTFLAPENTVPSSIPVLIPRENDNPIVQPRETLAIPTTINIHSGIQANRIAIQMSDNTLQAEHTGDFIPKGKYLDAGTGILTTAEGLIHGKQEYCRIFSNDNRQLLAVGINKGLYTYSQNLKEWVRVLADEKGTKLPANTSDSTWDYVQSLGTPRMIFQDIAAGTKTLFSSGYRPWAAVLSSTRVPKGVQIEKQQKEYAQNAGEVITTAEAYTGAGKRYFVTGNGDVVDIVHAWAKSLETFDLFCQLYKQFLNKTPSPTASIKYDAAREASFQFAINPNSLKPNTIIDTTFQTMMMVTYLMEGITQRYVQENFPLADRIIPNSGMTPEDMFSNSLAVVGMIALIRENSAYILKSITSKTDVSKVRDIFMKQVISTIIDTYGVRNNPQIDSNIRVLGAYPFLPCKVSSKDVTPTHLNLKGIHPNNSDVDIKVTRVPVIQVGTEIADAEIEAYINHLWLKLL